MVDIGRKYQLIHSTQKQQIHLKYIKIPHY